MLRRFSGFYRTKGFCRRPVSPLSGRGAGVSENAPRCGASAFLRMLQDMLSSNSPTVICGFSIPSSNTLIVLLCSAVI